jgi:hypothetical protein
MAGSEREMRMPMMASTPRISIKLKAGEPGHRGARGFLLEAVFTQEGNMET